MSEVLTSRGRRYAEANADSSIVARLALQAADTGDTSGWPSTHIDAAIRACNEAAADAATADVLADHADRTETPRYVVAENTPGEEF